MADTPMPVTGFSMDAMESPDGQSMVAVLTHQTGDLTFEFAINEDGAKAMVDNLQQFLDMSRGGTDRLGTLVYCRLAPRLITLIGFKLGGALSNHTEK